MFMLGFRLCNHLLHIGYVHIGLCVNQLLGFVIKTYKLVVIILFTATFNEILILQI